MVTKDDAMEFLLELEDLAAGLNDKKLKLAITERAKAIKKYVWNSDYKIVPVIKA